MSTNLIPRNYFLIIVFIFSMAVINGPSFGIADTFIHEDNPDVRTYMGLAEFDFDQSPVRRYRVIVPWLAAGIHFICEPIFDKISPDTFPGDFSMVMSFMIVNNIILGLWGIFLYLLCINYVDRKASALIGILSVLTCRWLIFIAGTPMVDSLYLLAVAIFIYGIIGKKHLWIIAAIYLGPWSKEAFIFFVPLLIFAERRNFPKYILHLVISGILVFSFRYWLDMQISADPSQGLASGVSHLDSIPMALKRLFSFHGIYEFLSIGGIWNLFIIWGISRKSYTQFLRQPSLYFWMIFVGSIFTQALLSTELARMFLLFTPMIAVMVAIVWEEILSGKSLND